MEFSINDRSTNSRRSSFWRYLPGFPRKSKEKPVSSENDITLISANKLYSSFRSLTGKKTHKTPKDTKSKCTEETHTDMRGTFLTMDNQLRWRYRDEGHEKHVQFAPTPLNKYHTYAGRLKGKENKNPSSHLVVPPILKSSRSPIPGNLNDSTNLKTMTLPRTSTKSAIVGSHNDFPHFDISAISSDDSRTMDSSNVKTMQSRGIDMDIGIPFVPKPKMINHEFKVPKNAPSAIPRRHDSKSMEFLKGSEIIKLYQPHRDGIAFKSSNNTLTTLEEKNNTLRPSHQTHSAGDAYRMSMPSLHSAIPKAESNLNHTNLQSKTRRSVSQRTFHPEAENTSEMQLPPLRYSSSNRSMSKSQCFNRLSLPRSKTRPCALHKKYSYDAVSSVADDECSLNCSCLDCHYEGREKPQLSKKGSFKTKLFFPETTATPPSSITEEVEHEWYNCNDSMCKSPVNPDIAEEPIYANNEVLIVEDYNISKDEDSTDDLDRTLTDSFPDMTPKTKKLSESCVSALQETLSNLFGTSEIKPSVTVTGFNNSLTDKPNTIVIQIQKSVCESTERNPTPLRSQNEQEHKLCKSRSLPELPTVRTESPVPLAEPEILDTSDRSDGVEPRATTPCSSSNYSTISSSASIEQLDKSTIGEHKYISKKSPVLNSAQKRKLLVSASPKKSKFKAKDVLSGKAKLKLDIYRNCGMVTVRVERAVKLSSVRTINLNPYVKVTLFPDDSNRVRWRTSVVQGENSPDFQQVFSFEVTPEDARKRLVFSVWHRDRERKRSEFLGCMSFGLHHVMESDQHLSGWYRLLKEVVGLKKHFAAGQRTSFSKSWGH